MKNEYKIFSESDFHSVEFYHERIEAANDANAKVASLMIEVQKLRDALNLASNNQICMCYHSQDPRNSRNPCLHCLNKNNYLKVIADYDKFMETMK